MTIPYYNRVTNEKAYAVVGNNPFKKVLEKTIERIAENNKTSTNWVEMNAKNHGLDLSKAKEEVIYFFTGNKEIMNFSDYLVKRNDRLRPTIKNKLKNIFLKEENIINVPNDAPKHIKYLADAMDYDYKETLAFNEYIKGRVQVVSTVREMFIKMMNER